MRRLLVLLMIIASISCTKDANLPEFTSTTTTAKTFNCSTTTADAASIQLLDPLSPKSWFNLSFCFTPPVQNIASPVIYTNADSMNITLQIFGNRLFMRYSWQTEKIDEYFYYPVFHPYPTPITRFVQKPSLQNGTYTFPINFKFEKRGLYNKFVNSYDTTLYNWDAYDFGMHSQSTNSYAYVRLVIKSDKP